MFEITNLNKEISVNKKSNSVGLLDVKFDCNCKRGHLGLFQLGRWRWVGGQFAQPVLLIKAGV